MKYGKIKIEDGNLLFVKRMIMNSLPCRDIVWAYKRKEAAEGGGQKQLTVNYLVVLTKRKKRYKFDMTEKEVQDCLQHLKALNPEMTMGYPKGGRIPLQSLPNTRDLGSIMTEDGRHILPRKLLRSGSLYHMSLADQDTLKREYNLTTVIDFRTGFEREEKPDTQLPYVEYYHIPIFDEETLGITQEANTMKNMATKVKNADDFLIRQYESMITDEYSLRQYARFMDVLLRQRDGAVLWHCSAGKDRAGVATALLMCVLGVSKEDVIEDYMKTNTYMESEYEHMVRILETKTIVDKKMLQSIEMMFKVKEVYLESVFKKIDQEYGSVEKFLRRGLYLTPKAIESLRDKYLI